MESTRGNTHSVTFFPPGNVFFGSMISTMHPLTTNTAAVLRGRPDVVDPSCVCRAEQACLRFSVAKASHGKDSRKRLKNGSFFVLPRSPKKFFLGCLTGFFGGSRLQGLVGFQRRLKSQPTGSKKLIERAATDLVRETLQQVIPAPPGKPVQTHSRK
jgi:hypothetical protein